MRWVKTIVVSAGLAAGLLAARPALADGITHVVQPGENLFRIGLAYGIGWQAIMQANGLYSTDIYVGEALLIPVSGAQSGESTPPPAATPAPAPAPTNPPPIPDPGSNQGSYIIQPGDTLWQIAQRYGVSVGQLMAANGITNPNTIYYGLTLTIPSAGAPSAEPQGKLLAVSGQAQALPLDCESRSAVDFAGYFGVSIGELDFLGKLPESDDPEVGFVGDAHGGLGQLPPSDYGVHAGPVAALLRAYGVQARAATGLSWDDVQAQIDAGRPVMVWVVSQVGYGTAVAYTAASTGHTTQVVPFEHTVMVIGYGPGAVTILDGGTVYQRSQAQFLASWAALGDMAVVGGS
jgi:LysM repeat protein